MADHCSLQKGGGPPLLSVTSNSAKLNVNAQRIKRLLLPMHSYQENKRIARRHRCKGYKKKRTGEIKTVKGIEYER